jgi:hydroxypyruvate isomerase
MPRFSANLSFLFNEVPFLERFGEAARAGFAAVEVGFAYDVPVEAIAARLADNALACVLINAPPGDLAAGERGIASLPGREREFAASMETAMRSFTDPQGLKPSSLARIRTPDFLKMRLRRTIGVRPTVSRMEFRMSGMSDPDYTTSRPDLLE